MREKELAKMARACNIHMPAWLTIWTMLMAIVTADKVAKYKIFSTSEDNFEATSSHTGYG